MKSRIRRGLWLALILIIAGIAGACAEKPDNETNFSNHRLESMVKPYTFNYLEWEIKTLAHELRQVDQADEKSRVLDSDTVVSFFTNNPANQDQTIKDEVENILASQISQIINENGINNSFLKADFIFPPVNFILEEPPHLLIVSPRENIESLRDISLKQEMSLDQITKLESEVEQLNVSALVTPIGGLGATYPTFVEVNSDLKYTIKTAAEEWLHQYLAFKPLGFCYVLDLLRIKTDPDIDSLNETIAGVAAQEIGDLVYARFYSQYPQEAEKPADLAAFDFNGAMRETRLTTDAYLASGQIVEAESYMEEQRQFINSHGYQIRKLNQAYFAFYGSYAYSPTSIDPLGEQIKKLRQQSASLKDFLQTASGLTTRQELAEILNN